MIKLKVTRGDVVDAAVSAENKVYDGAAQVAISMGNSPVTYEDIQWLLAALRYLGVEVMG
jgi:L-asparaginase II